LPFYAARWLGILNQLVFECWEDQFLGDNKVDLRKSKGYEAFLEWKAYSDVVLRIVVTIGFVGLFWGKGVYTLFSLPDCS
jgi:hypothetical protein